MSDTTPCAHHQFFGAREFCPDCGLSRTEALVEACAPFLKDDETPAECIARNRRDVNGCLTMLIDERRKVESLRSQLAEYERLLQEVYDCRQSLMSIGLVYRIGHTLNHRPADSAEAAGK